MRKLLLLSCIVFICPTLFAQSDEFERQILNSDLRRDYVRGSEYGRGIVAEHERLFPGALKEKQPYPTPLERLARIQGDLLGKLSQTGQYAKDLADRGPLFDLKFKMKKSLVEESFVLNGRAWERFRESLFEKLRQTPNLFSWWSDAKFDAEEVLRKERLNLANMVSLKYPDHVQIEAQALSYVILSSLLTGKSFEHSDDARQLVRELDVSKLDYLKDANHYLPLLAAVGPNSLPDDEWRKIMESAQPRLLRALYLDKSVTLKKGNGLELREVPANVAILRGYVGQDCATAFSPGFVFTPYDRYFYVYDQQGLALGYVGLSMVQVDGEMAVFLHTIQGEKLSAVQTKMIILGLKKSVEMFAATRLVLSTDRNIDNNVNYHPISEMMMDSVRGQKELPVEWLDVKYRDLITRFDSTIRYDDPRENTRGRQPIGDTNAISVEKQNIAPQVKLPTFVAEEKKSEPKGSAVHFDLGTGFYCERDLLSNE